MRRQGCTRGGSLGLFAYELVELPVLLLTSSIAVNHALAPRALILWGSLLLAVGTPRGFGRGLRWRRGRLREVWDGKRQRNVHLFVPGAYFKLLTSCEKLNITQTPAEYPAQTPDDRLDPRYVDNNVATWHREAFKKKTSFNSKPKTSHCSKRRSMPVPFP